MRIRQDRAAARAALIPLALWLAAVLLDVVAPLGGHVQHAEFVTVTLLIVSAVANFFSSLFGGGKPDYGPALTSLRQRINDLGKNLVDGLWSIGKALAKAFGPMVSLWRRVLKPALLWLNERLKALERWLAAFFKPILKFLADVKKHIGDFFVKYIRPILDTIEFIRAINRVLELFGIRVLSKVDDVLTQIENRLEEPFRFLSTWITRVENYIDQILTLDGFFQRLTLIRSLERYAPDWMRMFWQKQAAGLSPAESARRKGQKVKLDAPHKLGVELARFYGEHDSAFGAYARELVPLWREAAGLDPPRPQEG